jgi:amidase
MKPLMHEEASPAANAFSTSCSGVANPYDLTKTCGESTGGGAVALACGLVPTANGSDMGGSLRNPGNFCSTP